MEAPFEKPPLLRKNALGVLNVVVFVIATNGPLTALVGGVPAAITFGNGVGLPGVFLAMGLLYLLFSVGFSAMSRHITNAGAFYAYVATGLGQPSGIGSAFMAITSYKSLQLALYALLGFFGSELIQTWFGVHCPWWLLCSIFIAVIHYFGTRNIEFNGKMLTILMVAEVGIIAAFDIGVILFGGGPDGFTSEPFRPQTVFTQGFGSAIVFVASSYMGFETAAIYSEEARNPKRTISMATYIAVTAIMVFYAASTYLLTLAYGANNIVAAATAAPGTLWFDMADKTLGLWAGQTMSVLMITSLFAAILSFHNTISRYLFAMGREQIIWSGFARLHPTQHTPYFASGFQAVTMILIVLACGYFQLDPMTTVMPIAATPASIGVVAVQCLAAAAVIGFFWKMPRDTNLWQRLVAPAIACACLAVCLCAMVANIGLLTGVDSALNWALPLGVFLIGGLGVFYAANLRRSDPIRYEQLAVLLNKS